MARIFLGVTGGIAAYKACELLRLLVRLGHEVIPLVTAGADRFVRAETFDALARRSPTAGAYPHLERADLLVVAPLTANTLAKLAHGLADNVLTEAALAHDGPVLVAPAMNRRMWAHPATRRNVRLLEHRGVELVGPDEGELAEGETGVGRMAEPAEIVTRCEDLLATARSLEGARVLVTAGGTREPIDAVRYLGNRSSGRMGVALAVEAKRRGADVTLLAANVTERPPDGITIVETPTAEDMLREALARADSDLVLMAAAVADYRPSSPDKGKRPKDGARWLVDLEPTEDILASLGARRRNGQVLVGFAADHGDAGLARAREKLRRKDVDLVAFNDVSRTDIGFDVPDNEVILLSRAGQQHIEKAPKRVVAKVILDAAVRVLRGRDDGGRNGRANRG